MKGAWPWSARPLSLFLIGTKGTYGKTSTETVSRLSYVSRGLLLVLSSKDGAGSRGPALSASFWTFWRPKSELDRPDRNVHQLFRCADSEDRSNGIRSS